MYIIVKQNGKNRVNNKYMAQKRESTKYARLHWNPIIRENVFKYTSLSITTKPHICSTNIKLKLNKKFLTAISFEESGQSLESVLHSYSPGSIQQNKKTVLHIDNTVGCLSG